MGVAKRRKLAGNYPEQTPKPMAKVRKEVLVSNGMADMVTAMALLSRVLTKKRG